MAGAVRSEAYQGILAGLTRLRQEQSLSQAELAARIGKPPSFVGKYELGERRLDVIELFVLLKALDVDPVRFLRAHMADVPDRL